MPATPSTTNFDITQIFLGDNFYIDATYTNSSGSSKTIAPGTLLGRILATNKVLPNLSSATDGSEFPMGIAADNASVVVADGDSVTLNVCIKGMVNKTALTLGSGDTWSTVIRTVSTGGKTIEDALIANTGIQLMASTDVTITDPNQ